MPKATPKHNVRNIFIGLEEIRLNTNSSKPYTQSFVLINIIIILLIMNIKSNINAL